MNSKALSMIVLLLLTFVESDETHGWDNTDSLNTQKYDPNMLEDFKRVDLEILQQWQEMVTTVYSGYGYLKQEAEEELKKSVQWIKDFYNNVTDEYEEALYSFEQTYIKTADEPDYKFLYDIEAIVYDNLDELDETARESGQTLEKDYWAIVSELDLQQNDIEGILEITESRVDDIMDTSESEIENYIATMNEKKWEMLEVEYEVEEDIDDDFVDYYEDDEDDFSAAEYAAAAELINNISTDVEDFDTAPSDVYENDQVSQKQQSNGVKFLDK